MKLVLMEQPVRKCAVFNWLCTERAKALPDGGEMQKPRLSCSDMNEVYYLMTLSVVEKT